MTFAERDARRGRQINQHDTETTAVDRFDNSGCDVVAWRIRDADNEIQSRGVASLNQVWGALRGHNFGVEEQERRGPKGRQRGGVLGRRAASPSSPARGS